jgi:hypothetical protein
MYSLFSEFEIEITRFQGLLCTDDRSGGTSVSRALSITGGRGYQETCLVRHFSLNGR